MSESDLNPVMNRLEKPVPDVPFALGNSGSTDKMGDRFVRKGLLTQEQVQRVVALQQSERLRFGQAAVRLGFVSESAVQTVLMEQYNYAATLSGSGYSNIGLAIAAEPFSEEAEAIRQLRAQISMRMEGNRRVLAVMSPGQREGRSYLCASLAVAFAQTGQRTLLVNADLRASGQRDVLGQPLGAGLVGVLSGRSPAGGVRQVPGFPMLGVLDAGPQPPNPSELLQEPALAKVLESYSQEYEVFLVDTPALKQASEVQSIARQVDACLLVARRDVTLLADLEHAVRLLESSGARVLGTVFNEYSEASCSAPAQGWQARLSRLWSRRQD